VTSQRKEGDNAEENGNWVELGRLNCESYSTLVKVKRGKESFFFFSPMVCVVAFARQAHMNQQEISQSE